MSCSVAFSAVKSSDGILIFLLLFVIHLPPKAVIQFVVSGVVNVDDSVSSPMKFSSALLSVQHTIIQLGIMLNLRFVHISMLTFPKETTALVCLTTANTDTIFTALI